MFHGSILQESRTGPCGLAARPVPQGFLLGQPV